MALVVVGERFVLLLLALGLGSECTGQQDLSYSISLPSQVRQLAYLNGTYFLTIFSMEKDVARSEFSALSNALCFIISIDL